MAETKHIPVTNLLMDLENPRLAAGPASQREAYRAMLQAEGPKTLALAHDIQEKGLNPADRLMVIPSADEPKRFVVLEGNRRLTAIRILSEPDLAKDAIGDKDLSRLRGWSNQYAADSIKEVDCVVFSTREEAAPWIERRHTGEQRGIGVVDWGNLEKERFAERKTGRSSPALQVLDFVVQRGKLDNETREKLHAFKLTNLARLVSDKDARRRLGLEVDAEGRVLRRHDEPEVLRGLTRIVQDIAGGMKVSEIYGTKQREKYLKRIKADLPNPKTAKGSPTPLNGDGENGAAGSAKEVAGAKRARGRVAGPRLRMAPTSCRLNIANPRLRKIFGELQGLRVDDFPNAAAVLFRVFVELSADEYVVKNSLLTGKDYDNATLAKKLTIVADDLQAKQILTKQEANAVRKASNDKRILATSIFTLNQYVHNKDLAPLPSDLRSAWDNLQPFLEKVWA